MMMCVKLFRDSISFIRDIIDKRYLIFELTKRDISQRFIGSWLGVFWLIIEPLILTLIFWVVFGGGFRAPASIEGVPFIAWFLSAYFAWNYFSDVFTSGTGAIRSFAFLVKKVNFRLSILPVVKILSSLFFHLLFMVIYIIVLVILGVFPTFEWLLFFYYCVAASLFCLGLTWLTSSVSLFIKDVQNVVGIIIRIGFYATPIFWNISLVPEKYRIIFELNPMYYIIEGYRHCFLGHGFSLGITWIALYFWGLTFAILVSGIFVFKKLRPHFADVI
jgi:ABC-type polysaccharide/polyol phosphate export permease